MPSNPALSDMPQAPPEAAVAGPTPRRRWRNDPKLLRHALVAALGKLNPAVMVRNPVMFVVELGALLTTVELAQRTASGAGDIGFILQIALWLWFTVIFANFAEALAEARGKAQAASLRQGQGATMAKRLAAGGAGFELVAGSSLRAGDVVQCEAGDIIPGDGEIIAGIATVDESVITGESAPVIRESGGDRSAVTGGTRVLSDEIRIRITSNPGETFLDRMIALVEGAQRRKTPNEVALNILIAGLSLVFLLAVATLPAFTAYAAAGAATKVPPISIAVLIALLVCLIPTTIGGLLSAIGIAGMDRVMQHNVLAMSGKAVEAAGDVDTLLLDKTGTITLGNRQAVEFVPAQGVSATALADAAQLASLADETPEGRSIVVLAKERHGLRGREVARHFLPGSLPMVAWSAGFDSGQATPAGAPGVSKLPVDTPHLTRVAPDGRSAPWLRFPAGGARSAQGACELPPAEPESSFIPFSATTRMSGVDLDGRQLRKGAVDSIAEYVRRHGGSVSPELLEQARQIASGGGTPLAVCDGGRLLGLVHLKDVVKGGLKDRIAQLRAMGIRSVMITGDNPLTAAAIAREAGLDDFLAQATPQDKLDYIRQQQAAGHMVAMAGDGTNDAPALAQADVGLAMNTGTMAAREAGNMVDLDSNPTKLLEVVSIGKQLLITRGALTTFSIANDVAKYFAILPALFAPFYPGLQGLNVMRLHDPHSAVLAAVIFNALIIIALVPLALRGVHYRPQGAARLLRRNLLLYGVGGVLAPFPGIWAIDMLLHWLHLA